MRITIRIVQAIIVAVLALSFSSAAFANESSWTGDLSEVNNSGVCGSVLLTDNLNGTTTVWIELQGNKRSMQLAADIYDGKEDSYKPDPSFVLNDVVNGTSETVIPISLAGLRSESRVLLLQDPSGVVASGMIAF